MEYLVIAFIFSNIVNLSVLWVIVRKLYKVENKIPTALNDMEANLREMIKKSTLKKVADDIKTKPRKSFIDFLKGLYSFAQNILRGRV